LHGPIRNIEAGCGETTDPVEENAENKVHGEIRRKGRVSAPR
jgi:hypothetical protein